MTFKELKLVPPILKALEHAKYEVPTPIQHQAIPPILAGRDILGCAQTGTGKTAAFAVPTLQRLMERQPDHPRRIRSLVLTPTRELALQIHESFSTYGRHTGLRSCVIFGGVSQKSQESALRQGVDILVATPGRLNDLIGQQLVNLQTVEILTLDEADRMLDMGFIHDVRKILARTPAKKQTLFFSATMPPEIVELSNSLLDSPVKVSITPESPTVEAIEQTLYPVDKANKRHLLAHVLQDPAIESVLVFTRTKHGADRVARDLNRVQINAMAIHGNKSQNARQAALANFKNRSTRVLVATDIAARGLDISGLSHVINFDLPEVPESYVHRIGRTGRAGQSGIALSFCDSEERKLLSQIERLIGKRIPVVTGHPFPIGSAQKEEPELYERARMAPRQQAQPTRTQQARPQRAATTSRAVVAPVARPQSQSTAAPAAPAASARPAPRQQHQAQPRAQVKPSIASQAPRPAARPQAAHPARPVTAVRVGPNELFRPNVR
jgi:ATP-dependent RNA helicase RhlE